MIYDLIPPSGCIIRSEVTRRSSTSSSSNNSAATATTKLLKSFSISDLRAATKNFGPSSYLGEGGFGCVYKGWMDEATLAPTRPGVGRMVAIKKLKKESFQGHKEWLAEITYLGELHHQNLVSLVGYCCSDDVNTSKLLLVYEYMPRGSLENTSSAGARSRCRGRCACPSPWTSRAASPSCTPRTTPSSSVTSSPPMSSSTPYVVGC